LCLSECVVLGYGFSSAVEGLTVGGPVGLPIVPPLKHLMRISLPRERGSSFFLSLNFNLTPCRCLKIAVSARIVVGERKRSLSLLAKKSASGASVVERSVSQLDHQQSAPQRQKKSHTPVHDISTVQCI
jgi:hypothetical protein